MKISRKAKYIAGLSLLGIATLALVSWSPTAPTTAGQDIIMNTGKISISAGPIEAKYSAGSINGLAPLPAAVVGTGNNTDALGTTGIPAVATTGTGLVVGTNNRFGTPTFSNGNKFYAAVIGESNRTSARSSLIVGYGNSAFAST